MVFSSCAYNWYTTHCTHIIILIHKYFRVFSETWVTHHTCNLTRLSTAFTESTTRVNGMIPAAVAVPTENRNTILLLWKRIRRQRPVEKKHTPGWHTPWRRVLLRCITGTSSSCRTTCGVRGRRPYRPGFPNLFDWVTYYFSQFWMPLPKNTFDVYTIKQFVFTFVHWKV